MPKGLKITTTHNETIHKLYDTEIVKIDHESKTAQLETGGWMTMHTKKCINLALRPMGLTLRQVKGEWFVNGVPFQDGMRVSL